MPVKLERKGFSSDMKGRGTKLGIWLIGFWPGLPWAWYRAHLAGFAVALGFGLFLNFLLVSSFVWPHLLDGQIRLSLWLAALATSVFAGIYFGVCFRGDISAFIDAWNTNDEDLFLQAQHQYLKGEWSNAEGCLLRILKRCPRDVETRLMLATLYRHQQNWEFARDQLRILQRLEAAEPWGMELDHEWYQLERTERTTFSEMVHPENSMRSDSDVHEQGSLRDAA
ncbi:MAG: hypothetical protein R3C28_27130 [Pirellulaceae bacterium]